MSTSRALTSRLPRGIRKLFHTMKLVCIKTKLNLLCYPPLIVRVENSFLFQSYQQCRLKWATEIRYAFFNAYNVFREAEIVARNELKRILTIRIRRYPLIFYPKYFTNRFKPACHAYIAPDLFRWRRWQLAYDRQGPISIILGSHAF